MLNESTTQPVTSEEINQMKESNQNKILKQTSVEIEPCLGSLRKVECTPCKNYMYMKICVNVNNLKVCIIM